MTNEEIPALCFQAINEHKVQRRIVAAANRFGKVKVHDALAKVIEFLGRDGKNVDLVIPSARHYSPGMHVLIDELQRLRAKCGEPKLEMAHGADQGFIDQFDNYWTREEAFIIAKYAGQINLTREVIIIKDQLYSENIY